MYILTREKDDLVIEMKYFDSVHYKMDGNVITTFPPKINDGVVVYNSITDNWATTIVEEIEKVSDNEYNFKTKNSWYNINKIDDIIIDDFTGIIYNDRFS